MYSFDAKKAKDECVRWIRQWFEENGKDCNAVIGISGGKDSTVVAALCVEALGKDRVIGVMMPDVVQSDISDSREIITHLGIRSLEVNIGPAKAAVLSELTSALVKASMCDDTSVNVVSRQTVENLPPRLRMATLYAVAQSCNGRVSNNCNLSENWVGYSTIYGDTAGDFSPISNFTVSEVIQVGRELGVQEKFLVKAPSDGLCGSTDEEKLGFTYAELDAYIRENIMPEEAKLEKIERLHAINAFKHKPMAAFPWGFTEGITVRDLIDSSAFDVNAGVDIYAGGQWNENGRRIAHFFCGIMDPESDAILDSHITYMTVDQRKKRIVIECDVEMEKL